MAGDDVHRDLELTTPFTEGSDVKALQQTLNAIAAEFARIVDFKLLEDGKLGEQTLQATIMGAHIRGLVRSRLNQIEKQHLIIQRVQLKLRRPEGRTDAEKKRAKERRDDLRKKLDSRPSLKEVAVTLTAGNPHFGGSNDVMTEFVEPFMVKRGLPLGSGKRTPAQNLAAGGSSTSDHLTTMTRAAARDFPTFAGEDDARALAKAMGVGPWEPNKFTKFQFSAGGNAFRVQILWGAEIDHDDHVHVGISRA
jgi:hypothetical protein